MFSEQLTDQNKTCILAFPVWSSWKLQKDERAMFLFLNCKELPWGSDYWWLVLLLLITVTILPDQHLYLTGQQKQSLFFKILEFQFYPKLEQKCLESNDTYFSIKCLKLLAPTCHYWVSKICLFSPILLFCLTPFTLHLCVTCPHYTNSSFHIFFSL